MAPNLAQFCGGSPAGPSKDHFSQLGARHNLTLIQISEAEIAVRTKTEKALQALQTSKATQLAELKTANEAREQTIQSEEDVLTAQLQREQEAEMAQIIREHALAMDRRKKVAASRIQDMKSIYPQSRDELERECLLEQKHIEMTNERKLAELAAKREAAQSTAKDEYLALLSQMTIFARPVEPATPPAPVADDEVAPRPKKEPTERIVGELSPDPPSTSGSVAMDISSTPPSSPEVPLSVRCTAISSRKRKTPSSSPEVPLSSRRVAMDNHKRKTPYHEGNVSPGRLVDHPNKRVNSVRQAPRTETYSPSNNSNRAIGASARNVLSKTVARSAAHPQLSGVAGSRSSGEARLLPVIHDLPSQSMPAPAPSVTARAEQQPLTAPRGQTKSFEFEVHRIRFDSSIDLKDELWQLNGTQTLQLKLVGDRFIPSTKGTSKVWHRRAEWEIVPEKVMFVRYSREKARLRVFRQNVGNSKGFLWIDFASTAVLENFLAQFLPKCTRPGNIMEE